METITFHFRLFMLALMLSLQGGCAHYPDVSKIHDETPARKTPKIVSAKGVLSPQESRALMERLQNAAKPTDLVQRHNAVLETVTGSPLTKGNKVTLLVDGVSAYAAMFKAIENARDSINIETYKIEEDEVGHRFADLLLRKQGEGVQVNLIYDSIGSLSTSASFFDRLREAGVLVVEVNPVNPAKPRTDGIATADHRKMLIVDGRVVVTGGINISQVYASTPFERSKGKKPAVPWRDTDVKIEGPVVTEFQKFYLDTWLRHKGPPLAQRNYFPRPKEEGDALVRAICSKPGESNRVNYISYLSALTFAEHSIHLSNAYFIPDQRTLRALTDAARRGVDVRIVLPSISDSSMALAAMRYNYEELLKAGVKLYERRKALLHAKTAVIDGVWTTVGSTNIDTLSFARNYEADAVIISRGFADQLEAVFRKDLAESEQIRWEKWKKRPVLQKMKEGIAHVLSGIM